MSIYHWINHDIECECGRVHRCDIPQLAIGKAALCRLPEMIAGYSHVLLVADGNTWPLCGETVQAMLGNLVEGVCLFEDDNHLVPNEDAVEKIRNSMTEQTDFILGIGSGVINDLCKYVSFYSKLQCGIIATAPSMDGYASSGAAMILQGMKVTDTTHAPVLILGDTDLLKTAPAEMIRAGYADIIGKYSALCDWKLSRLINDEYFCQPVYDLVMEKTNEIRALAGAIAALEDEAIQKLMEALVLIGVCLTLLNTTRPGSGSEHHLSHYFEITGLVHHQPYFIHGIDVGYATTVTAGLREEIVRIENPEFHTVSEATREACYRSIYGRLWLEVRDLQRQAGRYNAPKDAAYRAHWDEVRAILRECPGKAEIEQMLTDVGFDLSLFKGQYGEEKIQNGVWFAKDLKDRYSVLWLYDALFLTEEKAQAIAKHGVFRYMKNAVANEASALEMLWKQMDEAQFTKALDMLLNSRLTITSACGSSGFATKKFAHSLCCVECPAKFVPPSEAVHGGMGALKEGNTMVLVSKGGKTDELLPLVKIAKAKKAGIIVITANPESALAKAADALLLLPNIPESDRYGVMSTASFAATVSIFDALMVGLMEAKDYQLEEFAMIHPGGAVGKQIN